MWGQISHLDCVAHTVCYQIHTSQMAPQKLLDVTDCSNSSGVRELFLHTHLQSVKLKAFPLNCLNPGARCLFLRSRCCKSTFSPRSYVSGLQSGIEGCKKIFASKYSNSPSGQSLPLWDGLFKWKGCSVSIHRWTRCDHSQRDRLPVSFYRFYSTDCSWVCSKSFRRYRSVSPLRLYCAKKIKKWSLTCATVWHMTPFSKD